MESKASTMQDQLIELYRDWLRDLQKKTFKDKGEKRNFLDTCYSNPYLCGIPDRWEKSPVRIMICGREGNGEISKDEGANALEFPKDISEDNALNSFINALQKNNLGYVNGDRIVYWKNASGETVHGEWSFLEDNHAFARTFKKFKELDVPIIWNECDKICHVDNKGYSDTNALTAKENSTLHNIGGKDILKEEIRITKPTHIIFLGYWRQSLGIRHSKDVFDDNKLYEFPFDLDSDGKDNYNTANALKMKGEGYDIQVYYFSHPQFKGKEYTDAIDRTLENISKDIASANGLDLMDYED